MRATDGARLSILAKSGLSAETCTAFMVLTHWCRIGSRGCGSLLVLRLCRCPQAGGRDKSHPKMGERPCVRPPRPQVTKAPVRGGFAPLPEGRQRPQHWGCTRHDRRMESSNEVPHHLYFQIAWQYSPGGRSDGRGA